MSADSGGESDSESGSGSAPGRREVAHRLFAAEFDDATLSYAESDEERAPKYVVTPTGARVNRLFAVGVLTEVESVNDDVLRARVVDPTGAFVSYAGQYQPDAAAFFERTDPPAFVALTGKARTFEPDDGDRIYTSVRPESVAEVDAETRDRWTVSAAEATLRRVAAMADARTVDASGADLEAALRDRGYDASLAAGIPRALDHYGTTTAYLDALRRVALDALEVVAGERDAVRALETAPGDAGTTSLGPLPAAVTGDAAETTSAAGDDETSAADESPVEVEAAANAGAATGTSADETATANTAASADDDASTVADSDEATDAEADATEPESEPESEPEPELEPKSETTDTETTTTGAADAEATTADELGDFDDGDLYELDDEERREVEESFDVGFESGAEVDDPGEADIDVPGPEDLAEEREADDGDAGTEDASDADAAEGDGSAAADVDLEAAAVDVMAELDDGDGAKRQDVVAAVVEEYGADPGAVADAIEDALMSGKCYEPSEDSLKAI